MVLERYVSRESLPFHHIHLDYPVWMRIRKHHNPLHFVIRHTLIILNNRSKSHLRHLNTNWSLIVVSVRASITMDSGVVMINPIRIDDLGLVLQVTTMDLAIDGR